MDNQQTAAGAGRAEPTEPKAGATIYSSQHRALNHAPAGGWPDEVPESRSGTDRTSPATPTGTSLRTGAAAATPASSATTTTTSTSTPAGTAGSAAVASK